jgi:hypothetical protein
VLLDQALARAAGFEVATLQSVPAAATLPATRHSVVQTEPAGNAWNRRGRRADWRAAQPERQHESQ